MFFAFLSFFFFGSITMTHLIDDVTDTVMEVINITDTLTQPPHKHNDFKENEYNREKGLGQLDLNSKSRKVESISNQLKLPNKNEPRNIFDRLISQYIKRRRKAQLPLKNRRSREYSVLRRSLLKLANNNNNKNNNKNFRTESNRITTSEDISMYSRNKNTTNRKTIGKRSREGIHTETPQEYRTDFPDFGEDIEVGKQPEFGHKNIKLIVKKQGNKQAQFLEETELPTRDGELIKIVGTTEGIKTKLPDFGDILEVWNQSEFNLEMRRNEEEMPNRNKELRKVVETPEEQVAHFPDFGEATEAGKQPEFGHKNNKYIYKIQGNKLVQFLEETELSTRDEELIKVVGTTEEIKTKLSGFGDIREDRNLPDFHLEKRRYEEETPNRNKELIKVRTTLEELVKHFPDFGKAIDAGKQPEFDDENIKLRVNTQGNKLVQFLEETELPTRDKELIKVVGTTEGVKTKLPDFGGIREAWSQTDFDLEKRRYKEEMPNRNKGQIEFVETPEEHVTHFPDFGEAKEAGKQPEFGHKNIKLRVKTQGNKLAQIVDETKLRIRDKELIKGVGTTQRIKTKLPDFGDFKEAWNQSDFDLEMQRYKEELPNRNKELIEVVETSEEHVTNFSDFKEAIEAGNQPKFSHKNIKLRYKIQGNKLVQVVEETELSTRGEELMQGVGTTEGVERRKYEEELPNRNKELIEVVKTPVGQETSFPDFGETIEAGNKPEFGDKNVKLIYKIKGNTLAEFVEEKRLTTRNEELIKSVGTTKGDKSKLPDVGDLRETWNKPEINLEKRRHEEEMPNRNKELIKVVETPEEQVTHFPDFGEATEAGKQPEFGDKNIKLIFKIKGNKPVPLVEESDLSIRDEELIKGVGTTEGVKTKLPDFGGIREAWNQTNFDLEKRRYKEEMPNRNEELIKVVETPEEHVTNYPDFGEDRETGKQSEFDHKNIKVRYKVQGNKLVQVLEETRDEELIKSVGTTEGDKTKLPDFGDLREAWNQPEIILEKRRYEVEMPNRKNDLIKVDKTPEEHVTHFPDLVKAKEAGEHSEFGHKNMKLRYKIQGNKLVHLLEETELSTRDEELIKSVGTTEGDKTKLPDFEDFREAWNQTAFDFEKRRYKEEMPNQNTEQIEVVETPEHVTNYPDFGEAIETGNQPEFGDENIKLRVKIQGNKLAPFVEDTYLSTRDEELIKGVGMTEEVKTDFGDVIEAWNQPKFDLAMRRYQEEMPNQYKEVVEMPEEHEASLLDFGEAWNQAEFDLAMRRFKEEMPNRNKELIEAVETSEERETKLPNTGEPEFGHKNNKLVYKIQGNKLVHHFVEETELSTRDEGLIKVFGTTEGIKTKLPDFEDFKEAWNQPDFDLVMRPYQEEMPNQYKEPTEVVEMPEEHYTNLSEFREFLKILNQSEFDQEKIESEGNIQGHKLPQFVEEEELSTRDEFVELMEPGEKLSDYKEFVEGEVQPGSEHDKIELVDNLHKLMEEAELSEQPELNLFETLNHSEFEPKKIEKSKWESKFIESINQENNNKDSATKYTEENFKPVINDEVLTLQEFKEFKRTSKQPKSQETSPKSTQLEFKIDITIPKNHSKLPKINYTRTEENKTDFRQLESLIRSQNEETLKVSNHFDFKIFINIPKNHSIPNEIKEMNHTGIKENKTDFKSPEPILLESLNQPQNETSKVSNQFEFKTFITTPKNRSNPNGVTETNHMGISENETDLKPPEPILLKSLIQQKNEENLLSNQTEFKIITTTPKNDSNPESFTKMDNTGTRENQTDFKSPETILLESLIQPKYEENFLSNQTESTIIITTPKNNSNPKDFIQINNTGIRENKSPETILSESLIQPQNEETLKVSKPFEFKIFITTPNNRSNPNEIKEMNHAGIRENKTDFKPPETILLKSLIQPKNEENLLSNQTEFKIIMTTPKNHSNLKGFTKMDNTGTIENQTDFKSPETILLESLIVPKNDENLLSNKKEFKIVITTPKNRLYLNGVPGMNNTGIIENKNDSKSPETILLKSLIQPKNEENVLSNQVDLKKVITTPKNNPNPKDFTTLNDTETRGNKSDFKSSETTLLKSLISPKKDDVEISNESKFQIMIKSDTEENRITSQRDIEESRTRSIKLYTEASRLLTSTQSGTEKRRITSSQSDIEESRIRSIQSDTEERKIGSIQSSNDDNGIKSIKSGNEERRIRSVQQNIEANKLTPFQSDIEKNRYAFAQYGREESRIASDQNNREESRIASDQNNREESRITSDQNNREESRITSDQNNGEESRIASDQNNREESRIASDQNNREESRITSDQNNREESRFSSTKSKTEEVQSRFDEKLEERSTQPEENIKKTPSESRIDQQMAFPPKFEENIKGHLIQFKEEKIDTPVKSEEDMKGLNKFGNKLKVLHEDRSLSEPQEMALQPRFEENIEEHSIKAEENIKTPINSKFEEDINGLNKFGSKLKVLHEIRTLSDSQEMAFQPRFEENIKEQHSIPEEENIQTPIRSRFEEDMKGLNKFGSKIKVLHEIRALSDPQEMAFQPRFEKNIKEHSIQAEENMQTPIKSRSEVDMKGLNKFGSKLKVLHEIRTLSDPQEMALQPRFEGNIKEHSILEEENIQTPIKSRSEEDMKRLNKLGSKLKVLHEIRTLSDPQEMAFQPKFEGNIKEHSMQEEANMQTPIESRFEEDMNGLYKFGNKLKLFHEVSNLSDFQEMALLPKFKIFGIKAQNNLKFKASQMEEETGITVPYSVIPETCLTEYYNVSIPDHQVAQIIFQGLIIKCVYWAGNCTLVGGGTGVNSIRVVGYKLCQLHIYGLSIPKHVEHRISFTNWTNWDYKRFCGKQEGPFEVIRGPITSVYQDHFIKCLSCSGWCLHKHTKVPNHETLEHTMCYSKEPCVYYVFHQKRKIRVSRASINYCPFVHFVFLYFYFIVIDGS